MQCENCGNEVPSGAKFCMHCGYQISTGTRSCPWCHNIVPSEANFCTNCGQNMTSLVIPSNDVTELRTLFAKGGCSGDMSREMLRALNLFNDEKIIAFVPKGRGGMIGFFNRGNNSFADLSINNELKHRGPFSTVITNNRLIFQEPNTVITFEDLRRYQLIGRVLEGRPRVTLTLDNYEIDFLLSLTTGTGLIASHSSMVNSLSDIFDSSPQATSQAHEAQQNSNRALAFIDAVKELFATIGNIWEQKP